MIWVNIEEEVRVSLRPIAIRFAQTGAGMGAEDEIEARSVDGHRSRLPRLGIVGIQESDDPCHWERISQPWEVLATPLGVGPFHNYKTFLATPNCILYHESFASRLKVHALSPEGMLAFAVTVRPGARTSWFGQPLHERGLPATLPGGAEAVLEAGQEHIMVLIRQTLLRQHLSAERVAALERAAYSRLLPTSAETLAGLGTWLMCLLTRTHGAPEMLRRRGFDRAIEYIRRADLETLDTTALHEAADVSPRTLEYAFREELGLSPAAFVRRLRLHALRRALLASALGESTVTELAFHLGFTQLGRLAGTYRNRFGESTSATLARPYRDEAPRLWAAQPNQAPEGARIAARE